jgi:hypothetical protein
LGEWRGQKTIGTLGAGKGVVAEKHSGKGEGEVLNGAEGLDIEEERDMGIRKLGA